MSKTSNKSGKSDADRLGEQRIKKYENRQKVKEEESQEYTLTAYQKIEPGNWEKITIVKGKYGYEKV